MPRNRLPQSLPLRHDATVIDRICETCNAPFQARNEQVRRGAGRFCSRRCRALGQPREPLETRLWAKIDKTTDPDGCWPWTGYVNDNGYGIIATGNNRVEGTHRVAFRLQGGSLELGQCVLHQCDNPPCCRYEHLFTGTQKDNIEDMMQKGRHVALRGEDSARSLLTETQVLAIRTARTAGTSVKELVAEYEVAQGTIYQIISRKTWKHLP